EPRVRAFAAMRLWPVPVYGKKYDPRKEATPEDAAASREVARAVAAMLRENNDRDPLLRHAGVLALPHLSNYVDDTKADQSSAVRRAVVLALRRKVSPAIARYLSDQDPSIVAEAARAIHDVPIPDAMQDLSLLAMNQSILSDVIVHRALNAHFRL